MSLAEGVPRTRLPQGIPLSATTNATGANIILTIPGLARPNIYDSTLTVRVYFVAASNLAPATMNSAGWFESAQIVKQFVIELSYEFTSGAWGTIPSGPYRDGGWFYAVQVDESGREIFGTNPVMIFSVDPNLLSPDLATEQVQDVSVAMVNINGIIQMTFRWQLPNVAATPTIPLGPLTKGHVQIWMFNYQNKGDWRQFGAFDVRARCLQYETGVVNYRPDFDGAHNVAIHFVACNSAYLHASVWTLGVSPVVFLVGGVGP